MCKFILFAVIALQSFVANSQEMKFWHKYKVGSRYKFEYSKSKSNSEDAGKTIANTTQFELIIEKEDISGIHVKWLIGPTVLTGQDQKELEKIKPLLNANNGFEILLLLNKEGTIIGIENYEECKAHIKNILILLTGMIKENITPDISKQLEAIVESTTSDASILLTSYFPEISSYFEIYGQTYSDGVFYIYETLKLPGMADLFAPFQTNIKITKTAGKNTELAMSMTCNQGTLAGAKEQMEDTTSEWTKITDEIKNVQFQFEKTFSVNATNRMVEGLTTRKTVITIDGTTIEEIRFKLIK